MDQVLTHIARQANLERILFTPALKKLYFDLAVSSGGTSQFKHADSIRNGLSFVCDQAKNEKNALLFCSTHELVHAYDAMLKTASELNSIVVLAARGGIKVPQYQTDSLAPFANTGWVQFHTATTQELYDHLAMAFHLAVVKKTGVPMLIVHSWNPDDTEFTPREDIDLGAPQSGFLTPRKSKGLDFDSALAAVGKKKEKPSLQRSMKQVEPHLREVYHHMGYTEKEYELPIRGSRTEADTVIITAVPTLSVSNDTLRIYCYRPFDSDALRERVGNATTVAVVEPEPVPGVTIAPFFAEISAALAETSATCVPVLAKRSAGFLSDADVDEIHARLDEATPSKPLRLSSAISDDDV